MTGDSMDCTGDFMKLSKTQYVIILLESITIAAILFLAYASGKTLGLTITELKAGAMVEHLDDYSLYELPSTVYDIHGEKITEFTLLKRKLVTLDYIPDNVINAFLLAEDARFFKHPGIDSYSILRAIVKNIKAGKIVEGGSTISQQLAKLLFTSKKRIFRRKMIELWYTLQLEKRYTKKEILEKYLNRIYFGHGVYGVEAASQYFFSKHVYELSCAESAILAIIPPAPNRYSPIHYPARTKVKQKYILKKMIAADFVSKQQADKEYKLAWKKIGKRLVNLNSNSAWAVRKDKAPYFSEYVRSIAEKTLTEKLGMQDNYLYTGGLQIYTTLDLKKQCVAREYLQTQLKKQHRIFKENNKYLYPKLDQKYTDLMNFIGISHLDSGYHFRNKQNQIDVLRHLKEEGEVLNLISQTFAQDNLSQLFHKYKTSLHDNNLTLKPEGALVSIDHNNGHIVAMVGGRNFTTKNQFNRAAFAKRQPGSTFKAFVYGAALQAKKVHPSTIVGYKGEFETPVTVAKALQISLNSVAVSLIDYIGYETVINFASPLLGIEKDRLPNDPSLALGTGEVTPLELCRGMAVFANDGKEVKPIAIQKIVNRYGRVIQDFEQENYHVNPPRQLISPKLARMMTHLLQGVTQNGTATRAVVNAKFNRPSAGKTGSTQKFKDAWFVGYTPNLTTAVWVGMDSGQSLGNKQYGGNVAAPVWANYMRDVHVNLPYIRFKKPGYLCMTEKVASWEKSIYEVKEFKDDFFYNIFLEDERKRNFYLVASLTYEIPDKMSKSKGHDYSKTDNYYIYSNEEDYKTFDNSDLNQLYDNDDSSTYDSRETRKSPERKENRVNELLVGR